MVDIISNSPTTEKKLTKKDIIIREERALIERCKQGDQQAFTIVYNRFYPKMRGYLYGMFKSQEDLEDVLSEGFTNAFISIHKYKPTYRFSTRLFRVVRNKALDHLRIQKRKRDVNFMSLNDSMSTDEGGEDRANNIHDTKLGTERMFEKAYTKERVDTALLKLKTQDSLLIELWYFKNKSYKEISSITGITENTMKAQLFRAKKKLAMILEGKAIKK